MRSTKPSTGRSRSSPGAESRESTMSSISSPTMELASEASTPRRTLILLYGVATYAFFFAIFVYTIGFVGGFVVPRNIENGTLTGTASAIAVDVLLLALFAIQHTVMARPAFK